MSIKAVAWAFEQSLDGDAVAKLVLLAICDRYNDEYGKAWPNIEWISRAADCSAPCREDAMAWLDMTTRRPPMD